VSNTKFLGLHARCVFSYVLDKYDVDTDLDKAADVIETACDDKLIVELEIEVT